VDPILLGLDPFGYAQDKRQIQAKSGRQPRVARNPLRAIWSHPQGMRELGSDDID